MCSMQYCRPSAACVRIRVHLPTPPAWHACLNTTRSIQGRPGTSSTPLVLRTPMSRSVATTFGTRHVHVYCVIARRPLRPCGAIKRMDNNDLSRCRVRVTSRWSFSSIELSRALPCRRQHDSCSALAIACQLPWRLWLQKAFNPKHEVEMWPGATSASSARSCLISIIHLICVNLMAQPPGSVHPSFEQFDFGIKLCHALPPSSHTLALTAL